MSAFPTPFDRLTDINALLSAVRKLEKSSGWKSSVQRITCDRLLMRPVRETFTRERRRLKTLYQLAACGKISITDYRDLYHSWRSNWIRFDCHRSLVSLDKTYRRYLDDLQH